MTIQIILIVHESRWKSKLVFDVQNIIVELLVVPLRE